MNTQRKLVVSALMLAFLIALPVARASEWEQATKLTFDKAVQIPGRVLPAGTYWFLVVDTNAAPKVVHIFNSDRTILYATILTRNVERSASTDTTAIRFAEGGAMQPERIISWFYPGFSSGHEFVYSNSDEKELAQFKQYTVIAAAQKQQQDKSTGMGN